MNDYERGRRDAELFSEVRYTRGGWLGLLRSDCSEVWILEPVTERYVCGLVAGGCAVEFARRQSIAA